MYKKAEVACIVGCLALFTAAMAGLFQQFSGPAPTPSGATTLLPSTPDMSVTATPTIQATGAVVAVTTDCRDTTEQSINKCLVIDPSLWMWLMVEGPVLTSK